MKKFITILATLTALSPIAAMASSNWTSVSVTNTNSASLTNVVELSATTGNNTATGGSAAEVVSGGGKGSSTSDNTATGGNAGTIETGDADAMVEITNLLGSNETNVMPTEMMQGTSTSNATEVSVDNTNLAELANLIAASVDTGSNMTAAGDAAGVVSGGGEGSDTSGNTAKAGMGAQISTGASAIHVVITSLLGSNITRFNAAP
jgi:hypothetical protein